jgi:hypothetical protein
MTDFIVTDGVPDLSLLAILMDDRPAPFVASYLHCELTHSFGHQSVPKTSTNPPLKPQKHTLSGIPKANDNNKSTPLFHHIQLVLLKQVSIHGPTSFHVYFPN